MLFTRESARRGVWSFGVLKEEVLELMLRLLLRRIAAAVAASWVRVGLTGVLLLSCNFGTAGGGMMFLLLLLLFLVLLPGCGGRSLMHLNTRLWPDGHSHLIHTGDDPSVARGEIVLRLC